MATLRQHDCIGVPLMRFREAIPIILQYLKEGYYPAKIARKLKINKGTLSKWLKKMEKAGMIERIPKTYPAFYEVKQTEVATFSVGDRKRAILQKKPQKIVRLHNVSFKYPILKDAKIPVDKCWKLKTHTQFFGQTKWGTYIKTNKSLIIHPKQEYGTDPYRLYNTMRNKAEKIRDYLQIHFGLVVGDPEQIRKPHYAVPDAYAKKASGKIEFANELGKIDQSEGEEGEIDWFSPEAVDEYLKMPNKVSNLEQKIDQLTELMKGSITQQQVINQLMSMVIQLQEQVLMLTKKIERGNKQ